MKPIEQKTLPEIKKRLEFWEELYLKATPQGQIQLRQKISYLSRKVTTLEDKGSPQVR